jgi:Lrp/AsnC family transcriptional regulator for asnA, asnC and gidA
MRKSNAMDSLDEQLLDYIRLDALQDKDKLAECLKVSSATVRRRIKKLRKSGILSIVGAVDPLKMGLPIAAIMAFNVSTEDLESFVDSLYEKKEIKWVSKTTGRYDVMALARFRSTDDLADFISTNIACLKGLKNTETFVCLGLKKVPFVLL